jgi:6-phosphogluconolactonase
VTRVVRHRDPELLARAAAEEFARVVRACRSPVFALALAGGSTPRLLYRTLAAPPFRDTIPWHRIQFFFGDERAVPLDHPESNYRMAREALLDTLGLRAHPMPAAEGDAEGYELLLRRRVPAGNDGLPSFDLVLLGVGTDGHTASLFPGTAALAERKRLVVMNDVPALRTKRMTFTFPLLEAARRVWILATGAEKREVVARALGGDPDLPVSRVNPRGELVWWLDEAAAPPGAA